MLSSLVDQAQAAFNEGRSLSDNVYLAQEFLKSNSRKHISPRYAIKVDICTAFDSVNWNFLKHILLGLGFPIQLARCIMAYVTIAPRFPFPIMVILMVFSKVKNGSDREILSLHSFLFFAWSTFLGCLRLLRLTLTSISTQSVGALLFPTLPLLMISCSSLETTSPRLRWPWIASPNLVQFQV